jgi:hypothetical protein
MRNRIAFAALAVLAAFAAPAAAVEIRGDYLETRSADVWTGPCFANGEAGLVGREAIMAWRVDKGAWQGVSLDGLSVVGVVKSNATLGDPFGNPYPAQAVMIVDEKATADQREALVSFAQAMGGGILDAVVRTEVAPIAMAVNHDERLVKGTMQAGDLAQIETRAVSAKDKHCGNEDVYYPPLTATTHALPAVAIVDQWSGEGLGVSWTTHDKRNAFVGTFAR